MGQRVHQDREEFGEERPAISMWPVSCRRTRLIVVYLTTYLNSAASSLTLRLLSWFLPFFFQADLARHLRVKAGAVARPGNGAVFAPGLHPLWCPALASRRICSRH